MICPSCDTPFASPAHVRACKARNNQDAPVPSPIENADEETHNLFSALITDGPPEPPEDYHE